MTESSKAVFLSYASQDADAAARICEALRVAGVEVWFDQSELRGGDAWDQKIRRQIRDCTLFIPIISASSQARLEGYFRREWRLAVERSHDMAEEKAFLVPVVIDDTSERHASVPDRFRETQWTRLPGGETPPAFCERVRALLGGGEPAAREHVGAGSAPVVLPRRASGRWKIAVTVGVLVAIAGSWQAWRLMRPKSEVVPVVARVAATVPEKSIAVLPFVDMSEKRDEEYFADGMAEEILDDLAKIPALKVIGRTSSFQFKGHNEDLRAIGAKLGVTNIVEGSVRKVGPRLRVTAQLIDARSGAHLWSDSYDRDFGDVLALQGQIAASIARALQLTVGANDVHTPRRLRSTDAYTFYLRGQSALDRGPAGWHEAQSDFEQALSLDPSFLRAAEKLTLAYGYEVTNSNAPGGTGWQHVREAADKTLHIDEHSSIAHADLGLLHGTYEYDWSAAETEYVMALASNSRDPIALEQSAWLALALGHYEQAARLEDDSLSLDPLNPSALEDRAYIERCTGDLAGAERAYRKAVEISPAFTENHLLLGEMLLLRGQHAAALTETQLAAASDGRDIGLAKVDFALGRTAESNAALGRAQRDFGDQWPHNIAEVYAYRGELDRAFEWLDRAYAARRHALPVFIRCDPLYAPLRGDPRYKTLLRKMNLPEP